MKNNAYVWDDEKNLRLKAERGISFEDVVFHVVNGHVLDIIDHPNQLKYRGQQMLIVEMREYAWLVPFVEQEGGVFLKTIIPSRKATKKYLGDKHADL